MGNDLEDQIGGQQGVECKVGGLFDHFREWHSRERADVTITAKEHPPGANERDYE